MNTKKWILLLISTLIITSACNLISNLTNPVDDVVSEIENMADDVNMEEIEEGIESLVTELPTDLGDMSDLQATAEALAEGFEIGEAPADIPVVEAEPENFFASTEVVSYMTGIPFDEVLEFYQNEMPENDWEYKDDGSVTTESAAVINYTKPGRDAIVTLSVNPLNSNTIVLITIVPK